MASFKFADVSEYLAITGWGIDDVKLAKKAWVWVIQQCKKFDITPRHQPQRKRRQVRYIHVRDVDDALGAATLRLPQPAAGHPCRREDPSCRPASMDPPLPRRGRAGAGELR
jgi:hypothetical protein